eukprot:scaffold25926_cov57-Cyclotella_meneghiniana.AAC.3
MNWIYVGIWTCRPFYVGFGRGWVSDPCRDRPRGGGGSGCWFGGCVLGGCRFSWIQLTISYKAHERAISCRRLFLERSNPSTQSRDRSSSKANTRKASQDAQREDVTTSKFKYPRLQIIIEVKGLRIWIGMHCGSRVTRTNLSTGVERSWILPRHSKICVMMSRSSLRVNYGIQAQTTIDGRRINKESLQKSTATSAARYFILFRSSQRTDSERIIGGHNSQSTIFINAENVRGRLFPPIESKKQISTPFLTVPYRNCRVTLCIVQAVGLMTLIIILTTK